MKRVRNLLLFTLFLAIFWLPGCNTMVKTSPGALLEVDSLFSEMSVKDGMFSAFLHFVDDSVVMIRDNGHPIVGREGLEEIYKGISDSSFTLAWKPLFEMIGLAGDMGYTWGEYSRTIKSTGDVSRGNYVTIWKRQADGSWKFVFDTGTEGLPSDN